MDYSDRNKDDPKEGDLFQSYSNIHGSADQSALYISDSKAQTLVKGGKPGKTLILKLIQSETCESWFQELFHRRSRGLGVKIPKQLVSLDEKYFKRCLELMHMNVLKGGPCSLSVELGSFDLGFVSDYATVGRRSSLDVTSYAVDYPIAVGIGDLGLSPGDEEIVGSVMGSNSMMRILKSPLFQRLGILDHNVSLGGTNLSKNKKYSPSDYQGSPSRLTSSFSNKLGKDSSPLKNRGYRSGSVQRSPISISSGASVLTDQSSESSLSPSGSQGMLHFTWDNGVPHFTFTLDDQKEVYVANAWRVDATINKALDYVYSFHLKSSSTKLFDISDSQPDLIGKMKVSTAFSLSTGNSRIMETEFVLVDSNENQVKEVQPFSRNSRQSRKLSKVMDVFKAGHSLKQRTHSLFGGSSAIPEDFSPEKGLEACCNSYQECKLVLSENDFLPNLEMAAVVVKDQLQEEEHQTEKRGGWGLNFLKKNVASSECCVSNVGDCSSSMDIIVPAGHHGGPRTRSGGPNSLIERWRSGGNCDCGGWDTGCPLKILQAKPRREEGWPSSEAQGDCKSFEMFTEGSAHVIPPLKMVNIREGLYFISFQPSFLSPLQCFSIAVAIIHSQTPSLRPKHVQD
ncbi:hypothetical protein SOVF_103870 [Spinacia oleracea]|uniref:Uncharacterized protein n=1 Tax=Spinacia oleracea TaxID=3562 RepID=A0A9R0IHR1_SPIOL|nr:uncharacterized protein LOC110788906 [Spinacia oleracea]KNA14830.1 hypothetical protein SOVF_103870 [Spinacia oleracea]